MIARNRKAGELRELRDEAVQLVDLLQDRAHPLREQGVEPFRRARTRPLEVLHREPDRGQGILDLMGQTAHQCTGGLITAQQPFLPGDPELAVDLLHLHQVPHRSVFETYRDHRTIHRNLIPLTKLQGMFPLGKGLTGISDALQIRFHPPTRAVQDLCRPQSRHLPRTQGQQHLPRRIDVFQAQILVEHLQQLTQVPAAGAHILLRVVGIGHPETLRGARHQLHQSHRSFG